MDENKNYIEITVDPKQKWETLILLSEKQGKAKTKEGKILVEAKRVVFNALDLRGISYAPPRSEIDKLLDKYDPSTPYDALDDEDEQNLDKLLDNLVSPGRFP
ncbi:hypothetical protein HY643_02555 [Candidatus Woesearchaeota archaeon]|nr:hypothetical protein [Candidatus Woesearchaeota archaeon]